MASRFSWRSDRLERGTWLFVLLLLVVLVPTACVLWFMNEAVTTQTAAARQTVLEAYRGQLRLVRSRVDAHWNDFSARLQAPGMPAARFARLILGESAEGLVLLNEDGSVAYPECCEPADRVAAADQQLLDAQRLEPHDSRRPERIERLAALLNDYGVAMPPSQRLQLMGELRLLTPNIKLPTEAALRLSMQVVESGTPSAAPGSFRPTPVRDVWAVASPDRRTIGLYRTGRLEAMMHDVLHQVAPEGIRFIAYPPDGRGDAEAIAAGSWLPGWQLSFVPVVPAPFDDAARRRVITYLWVGAAGIAVMAILGLIAGQAFRRHLRVAQLKTDLVAAVSHELRTPLTSMRVLVDGLLADAQLDTVKTREYLELIATENARLSRLIENFLTFSRLERHRHHFAFAPADASTIITAAVEAIRDRMPAACAIEQDVEPVLPPLRADAEALTTALVNLLDNAIKYTPPQKRILVRACQDAGTVVIAVQDNGIGIPAAEQRRIFHRFYRVDQRLASETSGVGLGLSIVDLIVRAHGGTVTVRSEPGAGSTFMLRMPGSVDGRPADLRRAGATT